MFNILNNRNEPNDDQQNDKMNASSIDHNQVHQTPSSDLDALLTHSRSRQVNPSVRLLAAPLAPTPLPPKAFASIDMPLAQVDSIFESSIGRGDSLISEKRPLVQLSELAHFTPRQKEADARLSVGVDRIE